MSGEIRKIESIKSMAVFKDFRWASSLRDGGNNIAEFKKINILYGRKRYEEFSAFLDWLAQTIEDERVDALLVAGDVFDTTTPFNPAATAKSYTSTSGSGQST